MICRPAPSQRLLRLVAAVVLSAPLAFVAGSTGIADASEVAPSGSLAHRLGLTSAKASGGGAMTLSSSVLDIVSSTGHQLRLHVLALGSDSNSQVSIQVQTRSGVEEHDWNFDVPTSVVSLSTTGKGRIHLTAKRTGGRATVLLRTSPVGGVTRSTCHRKTATKTRHVTLTGTVLLHTRTHGKHAWGNLGSAHKALRFSTKSKVVRTLRAASNCPTPEFPCRNTFAWQASGGPPGELDFFVGINQGAHAQIAGFRSVQLSGPPGASRSDILQFPQKAPNQLIVATDHSATLQATFRGGTATLSGAPPPQKATQPCGKAGKKKVSVEFWSADFANGATPILLPAQVFGDISLADSPAGAIYRIRLKH